MIPELVRLEEEKEEMETMKKTHKRNQSDVMVGDVKFSQT